MSKYFRPWNIDQTLLLPPNVQDFVPKDHVSRFIVGLVRESLDLKQITGSYVTRKPGWPTSSHASPPIPPIGWTKCYPGIGCHRRQRSWSKRRDHTRQQGPSRHHYRPQQLGENEDWLHDVANEMEIEDGVIWVYGVGEDGVLAFTDFGIESLIELIKMYKTIQHYSSAGIGQNDLHTAYDGCLRRNTPVG